MCIFFCKQKTAYEMRISDWSSDVCSSDLPHPVQEPARRRPHHHPDHPRCRSRRACRPHLRHARWHAPCRRAASPGSRAMTFLDILRTAVFALRGNWMRSALTSLGRSEEHTSELQSLMRISYAVTCLKKKKKINTKKNTNDSILHIRIIHM